MQTEINEYLARKVLETIDAGLVSGVGEPVPGKMCVEAAVCYAMGLPHGDNPRCVSRALRQFKICLNDAKWSCKLKRSKAMRRLGVAQLGSAGELDEVAFVNHLSKLAAKYAAKSAATSAESAAEYAARCAEYAAKDAKYAKYAAEYTKSAAWYAAKSAAEYAARCAEYAAKYADVSATESANAAKYAAESATEYDKVLSDFAEEVVQILIGLKSPGCKYLYLTEG